MQPLTPRSLPLTSALSPSGEGSIPPKPKAQSLNLFVAMVGCLLLSSPLITAETYIGKDDGSHRVIQTVLITRKGDTPYQSLIRYEPQPVPLAELPGRADIQKQFEKLHLPVPLRFLRVDQETEMLVDNLGQTVRSITSFRAYLTLDGHVVAYELVQTTGGQPQRICGHLSRSGVAVDVYLGDQVVDRHDIPFPTYNTFIPLEMEFIHQYYQINKEAQAKSEPVKFCIYVPEAMNCVLLLARPLGDSVIPVGDANWACMKYEVIAASTDPNSTVQARQEMWFDKRSGLLMKLQDCDPDLKPGEAPVTERSTAEKAMKLRPLSLQPPSLPRKPFPYRFDEPYVYTLRSRDVDLGCVSVVYRQTPKESPGSYVADATVAINVNGSIRNENATTRYDALGNAVEYNVNGEESADAKATYKIHTLADQDKINIFLQRHVEQPPPLAKTDTKVDVGARTSVEPSAKWHDPLRRIMLVDEEATTDETAAVPTPRLTDYHLTRNLYSGTFLFDFNRIEHLAAMAYRFPLPADSSSSDGIESIVAKGMGVGVFSVRQNLVGVVKFRIEPERQAVASEGQNQKTAAGKDEARLYVATSASALLPCTLLLTPDGRLLEARLKMGSSEVVYTLNDPIMRSRAERQKKEYLQAGPQLVRPPWW